MRKKYYKHYPKTRLNLLFPFINCKEQLDRSLSHSLSHRVIGSLQLLWKRMMMISLVGERQRFLWKEMFSFQRPGRAAGDQSIVGQLTMSAPDCQPMIVDCYWSSSTRWWWWDDNWSSCDVYDDNDAIAISYGGHHHNHHDDADARELIRLLLQNIKKGECRKKEDMYVVFYKASLDNSNTLHPTLVFFLPMS